MEYKKTIPFETNIIIHKKEDDFTLAPGDVINVCEDRKAAEEAIVGGFDMFSLYKETAMESYSTEQSDNTSIIYRPLLVGDEKYGFIGYRMNPGQNRVFFIYKMC